MQRWGVKQGFDSLEEALSSGLQFDVASVAAPTHAHEKILLSLLEAPVRAVLAEKPLGGRYASALRIVEAFERKRKPLLICYLRRFDPAMEKLRQEIASGVWGALKSATVHYSRGVMNNGSHAADLLTFLTRRSDFSAPKLGRIIDDGVAGDPTVDVSMSLGEAALHFIGCDGRDYAVFEISMTFEKGMIALEESGFVCRKRRVESGGVLAGVCRLGGGVAERTGLDSAFPRALDATYNVIHSIGDAPSTGRTALDAIRICETIRDRATRGET